MLTVVKATLTGTLVTHTHTTHTHTLTHVFALPQNYDAAKEVVVASTDPYYANLIPK